MTAAEALRRYHAAEIRLREVMAEIERRNGRDDGQTHVLQNLYVERDRLQAESFRVFTESRRNP